MAAKSKDQEISRLRRWYYRSKRDMFRWAINQGDSLNIWLQEKFNLQDPRQQVLTRMQDNVSLAKLDKTVGKELNIKPANDESPAPQA